MHCFRLISAVFSQADSPQKSGTCVISVSFASSCYCVSVKESSKDETTLSASRTTPFIYRHGFSSGAPAPLFRMFPLSASQSLLETPFFFSKTSSSGKRCIPPRRRQPSDTFSPPKLISDAVSECAQFSRPPHSGSETRRTRAWTPAICSPT